MILNDRLFLCDSLIPFLFNCELGDIIISQYLG